MQGTTTLTALDVDTPLAQTRTLILSLRPSIAWRIGMATAPVDLLDDNGLIGWRLGTERISTQLKDKPNPAALETRVLDWLRHDWLLEGFRWRSLHTVFARACLALGPTGRRNTVASPELVERQWTRNLAAALSRVGPHYAPSKAELRMAERLVKLLPRDSKSEWVRDELATLEPMADTPQRPEGHLSELWSLTRKCDQSTLRAVFLHDVN
jgi:hypothetical protein